MRATRIAVLLLLAMGLPAAVLAQAKPLPPLRIVSKAEPITFAEGGATRTYYRIAPGKPIELGTVGEMTLMIPVRAIGDRLGGAIMTSVTVEISAPGVATSVVKEILSGGGPAVTLSNGMDALAPKVLRIPITQPAANVKISVDTAPGAVVGFARAPLAGITGVSPAATPTAVSTPVRPAPTPRATDVAAATPMPTPVPTASVSDPALDPMNLAVMPLPLIRRRVERLGIGPRVAYVIPTGAVDAGSDGTSNLFAGAELRFTPAMLDRRLSLTLEGGTYKLQDVEPLNSTSPFGIATEGEVKITTQVVPMLSGLVFRQKLGSEKQAVFAGANGGIVLATRTEEVDFRPARSSSETRFGGQGRIGYERRMGPGRTVVEASYLHVTPGDDDLNDTYLGGAFMGLQYRFVF